MCEAIRAPPNTPVSTPTRVMPTCTVGRKCCGSAARLRASAAPGTPFRSSTARRDRRADTRASSLIANTPFSTISRRMITISRAMHHRQTVVARTPAYKPRRYRTACPVSGSRSRWQMPCFGHVAARQPPHWTLLYAFGRGCAARRVDPTQKTPPRPPACLPIPNFTRPGPGSGQSAAADRKGARLPASDHADGGAAGGLPGIWRMGGGQSAGKCAGFQRPDRGPGVLAVPARPVARSRRPSRPMRSCAPTSRSPPASPDRSAPTASVAAWATSLHWRRDLPLRITLGAWLARDPRRQRGGIAAADRGDPGQPQRDARWWSATRRCCART